MNEKRKLDADTEEVRMWRKKFKEAQEKLENLQKERETTNETESSGDEGSAKQESGSESPYSDPEFEADDEDEEDAQNKDEKENEVQNTKDKLENNDGKSEGQGKEKIETTEKPLEEDILKILGEDPTEVKAQKFALHSEVRKRWLHWLTKGLKKEQRQELFEKYDSMEGFQVPQINPELENDMPKIVKTRDNYMHLRQVTANKSITTLGGIMDILIKSEDLNKDKQKLISLVMDTGALVSDLHHSQTKSRRAFILTSVTKQDREYLEKTKPDEFLFGRDVGEKKKDAKKLFSFNSYNNKKSQTQQRQPLNSISLREDRPRSHQANSNQGQHQYKQDRARASNQQRYQSPRSNHQSGGHHRKQSRNK